MSEIGILFYFHSYYYFYLYLFLFLLLHCYILFYLYIYIYIYFIPIFYYYYFWPIHHPCLLIFTLLNPLPTLYSAYSSKLSQHKFNPICRPNANSCSDPDIAPFQCKPVSTLAYNLWICLNWSPRSCHYSSQNLIDSTLHSIRLHPIFFSAYTHNITQNFHVHFTTMTTTLKNPRISDQLHTTDTITNFTSTTCTFSITCTHSFRYQKLTSFTPTTTHSNHSCITTIESIKFKTIIAIYLLYKRPISQQIQRGEVRNSQKKNNRIGERLERNFRGGIHSFFRRFWRG